MSETRDLIGLYGAIDRAVEQEPGRRDPVSRLLPIYEREKPDEVHWFERLAAWTDRKREDTSRPAFPSLAEALKGLAAAKPPRGYERTQRLFAIRVAAHALPEQVGPRGELAELVQSALSVEGFTDNRDRAQKLHELLAEERHLPPRLFERAPGDADDAWKSLLEEAESLGLISDAAGMGPAPCTGRLVMIDLQGDSDPVPTLKTVFETDRVPFDAAIRFLDPGNWPDCSSFWCEMTPVGLTAEGAHQYHEVVSTDCDNKEAGWTIDCYLDFSFKQLDGLAFTQYTMSAGRPQPDVTVDEGSLIVQRLGSDSASPIRVITTKRVGFTEPFPGPALALLMCVSGYAEIVKALVFSCAALDPGSGSEFPADTTTPTISTNGPARGGSVIEELADLAATKVKECIDEHTDAARATSKKIADGQYTADALVQDMADTMMRMVRGEAAAVDLAVRSAQTAARTRVRKPPVD
jgi:hypothetical protein